MNKYKVLHTADWHIGKKILNFSRLNEQEKFLDFLIELIEKEKIDLLLIAGDVYDSKKPELEDQKLLNNFFYKLSFSCCKWCVIISGNHDKKDFLSVNKKILSKFNFFLVTEDIEDEQIIYLKENGETKFLIFCFPHINERVLLNSNLSDINTEDKGSEDILFRKLEAVYEEKINSIFSNSEFKNNKVPKILMAHTFFRNDSGVKIIGNSYVVPTSVLGEQFSYVALGHIHRFTKLKSNVYYSGSPIKYSFDENSKKYVNILTFNETALEDQKAVLLPEFSKLTLVKGKFNEVKNILENMVNTEKLDHYVKIELEESIPAEKEESLYLLAKSNYLSFVDLVYSLSHEDDDFLSSSKFNNISEILQQDEKYFFEEKLKQDLFTSKKIDKLRVDELISLFEEVLNKGKSGEYED